MKWAGTCDLYEGQGAQVEPASPALSGALPATLSARATDCMPLTTLRTHHRPPRPLPLHVCAAVYASRIVLSWSSRSIACLPPAKSQCLNMLLTSGPAQHQHVRRLSPCRSIVTSSPFPHLRNSWFRRGNLSPSISLQGGTYLDVRWPIY